MDWMISKKEKLEPLLLIAFAVFCSSLTQGNSPFINRFLVLKAVFGLIPMKYRFGLIIGWKKNECNWRGYYKEAIKRYTTNFLQINPNSINISWEIFYFSTNTVESRLSEKEQ
ncbi:hypothetical protein BABA_22918 [Neobacillus bataviensis LMG 21833]|uniref:Uncharacterized protein n=1 Tax=Neobacillus bataviensis LMG 21833 TaxID=1117379 RepID=K6C0V2_9BACI|nr:hypothetical protein [Neobacillus bataviensis]EKN64790.1 hypothetical protein BABA_22918 [Neobacillus bataviensis LMG 21833]